MTMAKEYFNQKLEDVLSEAIGAGYNQERGRAVVHAVHSALVNALSNVSDSQVLPGAGLVGALNVEYPDDVDVKLRIKGELGISLEGNPWITKDSPRSPERPATVLELTRRVYHAYAERSS
jgi:hypothetical protein